MSAIRCMLCVALWIWSVILPWTLLGTVTTIIAGILPIMYPAWESKTKDSNGRPNKPRHEKWFYAWLIGLSTLGGFWALFLPLALNQKFDGPNADGNQLRLHLLYITGGVLALTTLGETHRKNNLEKHKNDQDHTRQVYAERRNRYSTAVEQLSSDKASISLGGIYSLVGLADEWLADKNTIPEFEERHKEGQVIINNLCSYIRSPFDLASKTKDLSKDKAPEKYEGGTQQFVKDKARFHEEKELRLTILKEIKTRLNDSNRHHQDDFQETDKGPWSDFDYDFSNAHFFYTVDFENSYFGASVKFFGAEFTEEAKFLAVTFTRADFLRTKFSYEIAPEDYNFIFSSNSHKIETEKHEFNGLTFTIPKGAMLFNPDDPHEQDRIRQIQAERRNRHTTAIEHLSNDKASIRLGGVYTLVGLVDEWIADEKTIPNIEERRKEGQVIINNLCAYIRSPFLLAEGAEQLDEPYAKGLQKDVGGDTEKFDAYKHDLTQDKAILEECQVRSTILQKIHERLQSGSKPGPWSNFEYNFSNTKFFYPVNFESSYFCKFLDFSGAAFIQDSDFSGAGFADADFSGAKFTRLASFSEAGFADADFSGVNFGNADFSRTTFTQNADFSGVKFFAAIFFGATFTQNADFSGAKFTDADFSEAGFADADFSGAKFTGDAHFSGAEFTSTSFSKATFEEKPIFVNIRWGGKTYKARFSSKANPEDYNFEVSPDSPYKIETEEKEYDGTKFIIPKDTELFNPDDPSEQKYDDDS